MTSPIPLASPATPPGVRSCSTCPSFLAGPNQSRLLGSSIGGAACGRKMIPLVMPIQGPETSQKVFKSIAKDCAQHGESVNLLPLSADAAPEMRVGMDTEAMNQAPDSDTNQSAASCATCAFYVPAQAVRNATGWTGSICRKNGWLMSDARLTGYAKKCHTYKWQVGVRPANPLVNFVFYPQYDTTFGTVNFARQYESRFTDFVDPRDYPTDRPVSDKARATRGIRAWRKVSDPKGYGEDVYLPIFDPKAQVFSDKELKNRKPLFTEAALATIPQTGDREAPEQYADHGGLLYTYAVLWMKLDETPAAWGMGGTGKTELSRHIAWLMQLPLTIIAIDGSSEVDTIAGKMLFEGGETRPHYGQLPNGWMSPNVLTLDEPNTGPIEVWQIVRPLTDNRQTLTLSHLKDERIERHPDCYFNLCMNPQWHPLNIGAQMIGDADISRLTHVFFDYPPKDLEKAIIQKRVSRDKWSVPDDMLEKLMLVAAELRELSNNGTIHTSWGVRHQIKLARMLRWFDPMTAYRRAIGDALEPQQWEEVMSRVRDQFGE